jgi:hypothetical protein
MVDRTHALPLRSIERTGEAQHQTQLLDDGIMIRVPVSAPGKTLYFIVDTGFPVSAIDTQYKPQLGDPVATFSADSPLETLDPLPFYRCPDLTVAGKPFTANTITCLDLKMAGRITGQPCDGIIGMDFFVSHVVLLDFARQRFAIYEHVPKRIKRTFIAVPVRALQQHYVTDVRLNHRETIEAMVDTGDNSSLSLNPATWRELFGENTSNRFAATVSSVGQRIVQSGIGIVGEIDVQGLVSTNLHATLIQRPNHPSHLGLGYFKRHTVLFDLGGGTIYLQPRANYISSDKEDMSGLHLIRENQETIVYSVDNNSPASKSGIRPQDVITAVNGQDATTLSLRTIRRTLKRNPGDWIRVKIRREANTQEISFQLQQIL